MFDWTKPLFIVCTTLPAFLSGVGMSFSIGAVPAVVNLPDSNSRIIAWRNIYYRGYRVVPTLAVVAAIGAFANAYVSYHPQIPERAYKFIGTGALTFGVIPYTLLLMMPTNHELERRVERVERGLPEIDASVKPTNKEQSKDSSTLMNDWVNYNYFRALLPLAGALLAFEAL